MNTRENVRREKKESSLFDGPYLLPFSFSYSDQDTLQAFYSIRSNYKEDINAPTTFLNASDPILTER